MSPLHRAKTKRFLERIKRTYEQGARHYFMTRGPIIFLSTSALLVTVIFAIDGNLRQLMRPRVAGIEILALLFGTNLVTLYGWRLMKPSSR